METREQMSSPTNRGKLPKVVPPAPQSRSALGAQQLFPNTNVEIDIRPPFELSPNYTGRRDVLRALEETFATSLDKSSLGFALLVGEAGMGKSRTMREFVTVIEDLDPDVRVLVGNCKASDKTYAAMAMLLSARFGIVPSDSDAEAQAKLEAGIAEVMSASRVTEVAHLLAHLMRRPYPDSQVVAPIAHSHQQLEVRTFLALKRFCQADAKAGPLVLCFENLEQADSATINLLHFLVSGLSTSPIVVLGTATGELFESFPLFGDTDVELQKFELGSLTETESESLFKQLCRSVTEMPASLVAHAAKLGGSPRAIFELVRY